VSVRQAHRAGPVRVAESGKNGTVALARAQVSMLLEGIDWRCPVHTAAPQIDASPWFEKLGVTVA
jgi:hypothetical protein